MAEHVQRQGIVTLAFSQEAAYTAPKSGDKVRVSGDYEVAPASETTICVGEVFAINTGASNVEPSVSVELRGAKVDAGLAKAAIAAGAGVVAFDATHYREYVPGTDDPQLLCGVALIAATALDDLIDILIFG